MTVLPSESFKLISGKNVDAINTYGKLGMSFSNFSVKIRHTAYMFQEKYAVLGMGQIQIQDNWYKPIVVEKSTGT